MHSALNVLVVDDQNLVRESMKQILQNHPNISSVTQSSSGKEAIELAKQQNFDIALVDLKMPEMGGEETSKELLAINPETKILIVTACIDDLVLPALFESGISGYFTKSDGPTEIIKAIKTIQSGQRYISSALSQQVKTTDTPHSELSLFDTLSERELQVVLMLINGKNIQKIADKLAVNTKTINSYRARSFQKLSVENDVELTLLAARRGLVDDREGDES